MKPFAIQVAVALLSAAVSFRARAAYLESGQEGRGDAVRPRPPPPPPHFVPPEPGPGAALRALARRVEVGAPHSYRGLTVYPLLPRERAPRRDLLTLDEALSRGQLVIREKDEGRVGEVRVRNDARRPVFLMTGEIILGGRQNRILRDDVLLPAESGFIDVGVYCGEQDRWQGKHARFDSGGNLSAPGLRQMAAEAATQDRIWGEIDGQLSRAKVAAPTRSYQQVYEDGDVRRELDRCVAEFRRFARPETVGCIVASRGGILGCDLFADADLFARLWPKICRSYAMDVVLPWHSKPEPRPAPYADRAQRIRPPDAPDVRDFLDRVLTAGFSARDTPGRERLARISGDVSGNVLEDNGQVVHAAVFPGYEALPMRRGPVESMPLRGGPGEE